MVSPMLSDQAREVLRPVFGARRARRPWIQPTFAARTALEDRLRPRAALPFPTREQQEIHRAVGSLVQVLGDEMEDRAAQAAGVEQRHPFYDRRVAEFGLALPSSQRADRTRDQGRDPARARRLSAADRGRTDERSPTRRSSRRPTSTALEAFGGREAFVRLRSEDAGWVDGRVIRQMYDGHDSALQARRRCVHCLHGSALGRGVARSVARCRERRASVRRRGHAPT